MPQAVMSCCYSGNRTVGLAYPPRSNAARLLAVGEQETGSLNINIPEGRNYDAC